MKKEQIGVIILILSILAIAGCTPTEKTPETTTTIETTTTTELTTTTTTTTTTTVLETTTSTYPSNWEYTEDQSKLIAEDYIKKDSTYAWDGYGLTYKKTYSLKKQSCPYCWQFEYKFNSTHGGYGNRTGVKNIANRTVSHYAVVVVHNGRVATATLDASWDMMVDGMIVRYA